jgi:acyl-CoA synthetase (AMP-forming)/AMP-acid ligase II
MMAAGARITIPRAIDEAVHRRPDRVAVFQTPGGTTEVTVGDLHLRARRVASGLRELGVGQGDVVAVQLTNRVEWALAFHATVALGAVLVPIIPIYGSREVGFILRESGAKVLIVPERLGRTPVGDHLAALDLPELVTIVVGDPAGTGAHPFATLEAARDGALPGVDAASEDPCVLVYTSGTSANPKGVLHCHRGLLADIAQIRAFFAGDDYIVLAAFPFGHIAGLLDLLRLYLLADRTIVMEAWDASAGARLVDEHAVTSTAGTPFHLGGLLDAAEAEGLRLSTVREYITGAAAVPPPLIARAERAGVPTVRCYGCSEHPTISSGHPSDPLEKRTQTDGRVLPGTEVRILRDDDTDAGDDEDGEIVVRGDEQFLGYRDPSLNTDAYVDGWLRTGDIGRLDGEGFLTITDRKKDIIVRGGENISSREVEDALAEHAAIAETAVVAMPDPRYGERVCAYVRLRPGADDLTLEDVRAHFATLGLARQKTPEKILVVDDFPRTPSGKVKKPVLREQVAALVGATPG